jgi:hypothetical protein
MSRYTSLIETIVTNINENRKTIPPTVMRSKRCSSSIPMIIAIDILEESKPHFFGGTLIIIIDSMRMLLDIFYTLEVVFIVPELDEEIYQCKKSFICYIIQ